MKIMLIVSICTLHLLLASGMNSIFAADPISITPESLYTSTYTGLIKHHTFIVSNLSNKTEAIPSFNISGSSCFSIQNNNCTMPIVAGSSCTFEIAYVCSVVGENNARLEISMDEQNSEEPNTFSISISLNGLTKSPTLNDLILALRILTGIEVQDTTIDINDDSLIDLVEAIYICQGVAGIR